MIRSLTVLAAMAIAAPVVAQTADPTPAPVIAAERAFAADGLATGVDASFLKWSAPEAVMIAGGGPKIAHEILDPNAVFDPAAPSLVWWPNWAGISMSGDLGFTTGGVEVGGRRTGHYFTIWKRQPDGGWKWVYDGGSGASAAGVPGADTEPQILPVATAGSESAGRAQLNVLLLEAFMARGVQRDQKMAHLFFLADNARLYVAPRPPAIGREAFAEALDAWPATFTFGPPDGGGGSEAGDMVWTYGTATWARDGEDRHGWYVHLWQMQAKGWAIVLAQLIIAPPATATPPPAS
jgi:ketosteroid isomerase-like protein